MIPFLIMVAIVLFGLGFFERILARKPQRWPGLIMPVAFLVISVMALVQSLPTVFGQMMNVGNIAEVVLGVLVMLVALNIPTLITYGVFVFVRRRQGLPIRRPKE